MGTQTSKSQDELKRSVNAKALELRDLPPGERSSAAEKNRLWTESRQFVLRIAKALLNGSEIETDDVAQVVLQKASTALPRFRYDSEFTTWLFKITIRTVADFRRGIRSNVISLEDLKSEGLDGERQLTELSEPPIDFPTVLSVDQKLEELSPEVAAIAKRRLRGESIESIGQSLGLRPNTVRQKISRGMRRLIQLRHDKKQVELERTSRKPAQSHQKNRRAAGT